MADQARAAPAHFEGWNVVTARRGDEDVAHVYTRGPEIHIETLVAGRALTRRNIIEHLAPLVEEFGYATTRVPIAETDHKLREKLGFLQTWQDDKFTYWAMTELPYQKEKSCL